MRFNYKEKKDLLIAGLMISIAFAILFSGGYRVLISSGGVFLVAFSVAFFTAGIGFLLHELMHKYVAQRYGLFAEFKAFYGMLWLAILFSMFGFIIAAPGAVMIRGNLTREKNGKIALAGPLTNIILALIFLALVFIFPISPLKEFLSVGLTINALLAAFNMIPTIPFDGGKVIAWDKKVYTIITIIAVGLFIGSFFV